MFNGVLYFLKKSHFPPQTVEFSKRVNLFCLAFLTNEFSFAVFFLQLTQYVSNNFYIK